MIAIIGGTGLEKIGGKTIDKDVETPFGLVQLQIVDFDGKEIVFLSRHDQEHTTPPHKINYKANIWALKMCNVTHIIAVAAVGSLRIDFEPGMFGIVDQYLDFTKNRDSTYFDSFFEGITHTDMTNPYSEDINQVLETVLIKEKCLYKKNLVLVVTEGPRFETSAEIKAFSILGAEIVGMTGYPEIALARELGLEYSCLAVCTNYAAGITKNKLTHDEVLEKMKLSYNQVKSIIKKTCIALKDFK